MEKVMIWWMRNCLKSKKEWFLSSGNSNYAEPNDWLGFQTLWIEFWCPVICHELFLCPLTYSNLPIISCEVTVLLFLPFPWYFLYTIRLNPLKGNILHIILMPSFIHTMLFENLTPFHCSSLNHTICSSITFFLRFFFLVASCVNGQSLLSGFLKHLLSISFTGHRKLLSCLSTYRCLPSF